MTIGTQQSLGASRLHIAGDAGVDDGDIIIETGDASRLDTFQFSCGAGGFDVFIHDGVQWVTSPHSMADLGATTNAPVVVAVALRDYGFTGFYFKIRVQQKGSTACTGSSLRAKSGRS